MATFDDFLNESILNEIGNGGTLDSIATAMSRKVKNIAPSLKAKLGSKKAQGELSLRDTMAELEDGFKVYCAEQRFNPAEAAVEDFLEYLRHGYGFAVSDENFDGLAYGPLATMNADKENEINQLVQQVSSGIEDGEAISDELAQIAAFAEGNDGNSRVAKKALWRLARAHPSRREFRKVKHVVGRPLGPKFSELSQKIASLILKLSKGGGGGSGSSADKNAKKTDSSDLNVGMVPFYKPANIEKEKWGSPLYESLSEFGLPTRQARRIAGKVKDTTPVPGGGPDSGDTPAEMAQHANELKRLNLNEAINVLRILLQLFRVNQDILGPRFFDKLQGTISQSDLSQEMSPNNRQKGASGDEEVYDGTRFNLKLANHFRDPETARGAVVALLGCTAKVIGG
jgi:hypothetical protein